GEASLRQALTHDVEHFHHARNHQRATCCSFLRSTRTQSVQVQCSVVNGLMDCSHTTSVKPHEFFDHTGDDIHLLSNGGTTGMNQSARRCILAVFAHPDDETSTAAGTFIKYAREGVEIHVVTATRGECGELGTGDLKIERRDLPAVREAELRAVLAL